MGFGGGGSGGSGVESHWHNSQTGNGGPLKLTGDTTTGTTFTLAGGGTEILAEAFV